MYIQQMHIYSWKHTLKRGGSPSSAPQLHCCTQYVDSKDHQSCVHCSVPFSKFTYPILLPTRETCPFLTYHQAGTPKQEETVLPELPFQGSSPAIGTLETSQLPWCLEDPGCESSPFHSLLSPGHN